MSKSRCSAESFLIVKSAMDLSMKLLEIADSSESEKESEPDEIVLLWSTTPKHRVTFSLLICTNDIN